MKHSILVASLLVLASASTCDAYEQVSMTTWKRGVLREVTIDAHGQVTSTRTNGGARLLGEDSIGSGELLALRVYIAQVARQRDLWTTNSPTALRLEVVYDDGRTLRVASTSSTLSQRYPRLFRLAHALWKHEDRASAAGARTDVQSTLAREAQTRLTELLGIESGGAGGPRALVEQVVGSAAWSAPMPDTDVLLQRIVRHPASDPSLDPRAAGTVVAALVRALRTTTERTEALESLGHVMTLGQLETGQVQILRQALESAARLGVGSVRTGGGRLNVRTLPGLEGEVFAKLVAGAPVAIQQAGVGPDQAWHRIAFRVSDAELLDAREGRVHMGYVHQDYLSVALPPGGSSALTQSSRAGLIGSFEPEAPPSNSQLLESAGDDLERLQAETDPEERRRLYARVEAAISAVVDSPDATDSQRRVAQGFLNALVGEDVD